MPQFLTVHLRVNDADTGKPTPVRLSIVGPNGEYYASFGRASDFPGGRGEQVGAQAYRAKKKSTCIDGSCEIRLPTGVPLEVEISKGPEYEAVRETVTLGAGQMALRYTVRRWFDRHKEGWRSADTRCHFMTPHDALLEGAAEDLDFVHLLATESDVPSQDGHLYRTVANLSAFSGQKPSLESGGHAVVVNTFNTHPVLGKLGLLNSHRPVFPLSFGGEETDDWSLGDWCNQCHRKNGLTVWCEAYRPEASLPGGEALLAAILGKIDAFEIDARERGQPLVPLWYRLLNAGVKLPLVGGSGKDSNRSVLGSMRTYTLMESEAHGLADWVERTRQGRTFVTNGPLLSLLVNGQPIGATLATGAEQRVTIRAEVRERTPTDRLEIVVNGEVVGGNDGKAALEVEHLLPAGGWIAARRIGRGLFAHTSPVYVEVAGRPRGGEPSAVRLLRRDIEGVRQWIETTGRFANPKSQLHLREYCDEALKVLADCEQAR